MEIIRTEESAVAKMRAIAAESNICMLITNAVAGERRNRPMAAVTIDDEGNCWFFASKSSGKLKDIQGNNKIQLVYAHPENDHYLEVHGTGVVICDQEEIARKWSPLVNEWFPAGITDPEVCLVKLEVTIVFYWDTGTKGIRRLVVHPPADRTQERMAA